MKHKPHKKTHQGFTLIELVLVIALFGLLSAMEIVSILPILSSTRDAAREQTIIGLSQSLQAYALTHNGNYPNNLSDNKDPNYKGWVAALIESGDLKQAPTAIPYIDSSMSGSCGKIINNEVNEFCYNATGPPPAAVIWTKLESDQERRKCPEDKYGKDPAAYFIWSSADSRAGIICFPSRTTSFSGFTFSEYY